LLVAMLVLAHGAVAGGTKTIVAFGDSLTAGYGLDPADSYTVLLEKKLQSDGIDAKVVNAGVSGDTSTGGRARLEWTLDGLSAPPDLVILELGANDALRGESPDLTFKNLDWMLGTLKKRGIPVLLAGMMAPPNMGREYEDKFNAIYPKLAKKYGVAFYPFFLDGVAANPKLNQGDGMHPNPEGEKIVVDRIAPYVIRALSGAKPATAR
jgi:acyl-CoA thioesterase-1